MRQATGAGVAIEPLDRDRAEREADVLLALGADLDWDTWTPENLLGDRPGKWQLSLVAVRDGEPVAYAISSRKDDDIHLHHIVVAPSMRGSGLGAAMLERLRAAATDAGARRLTLKVYRTNEAAIRFYEREGFSTSAADDELLTMAVRLEAGRAP